LGLVLNVIEIATGDPERRGNGERGKKTAFHEGVMGKINATEKTRITARTA
jgi:hypothetical protein